VLYYGHCYGDYSFWRQQSLTGYRALLWTLLWWLFVLTSLLCLIFSKQYIFNYQPYGTWYQPSILAYSTCYTGAIHALHVIKLHALNNERDNSTTNSTNQSMFSLSVSLSILCFTVCLFRWSNMPKLFWPAQIDDLHLISIVDLFSIFDTTIVRFLILPAYMLCCPSMLNLMHSFSIWDIWVTTSIYNKVVFAYMPFIVHLKHVINLWCTRAGLHGHQSCICSMLSIYYAFKELEW